MSTVWKKRMNWIAALMILLLAIFVTLQMQNINLWLGYVLRVLRPVLIGLVLAYLCNPIFRLFERKIFGAMRPYGLRRALSLLCTYLVLFLIFAILLLLIVPQLISSIFDFFENYEEYLETTMVNVNGLLDSINSSFSLEIPHMDATSIKLWIANFLENMELQSFLGEQITPENIWMLIGMIEDIVLILADVILGLFISLYILNSKERQYAQTMRFREAFLPPAVNERLTNICSIADRSFGGFLRGKLLDSTLVGIIVYILISILKIPYAPLIAVIIGITDIVPVIGPFIGVIPSAVIILLADPMLVIPFLLCILVVQQLDGNIIAPKILGDNTGVSSLCVMIAITLLGAIWGLVGMVVAVPLFATVMELSGSFLEKRLRKKGLPVETESYYGQKAETKTAASRVGKKKLEKNTERPFAAGGKGTLTDDERTCLRAYLLSVKHGVLRARNEESFAAFAEEFAPTVKSVSHEEPENTEHQTDPSPEP